LRPSFQRSRETWTGRSASGTNPSAFQSVMERRSLKRFSPMTLETCVKSGPFTPRALPRFLATMGRSDSRPRPAAGYGFPVAVAGSPAPRRVSRDPSPLCRRAPSSIAPGSPTRACARCYRIGGRLHHLWKSGRCQSCDGAESGSPMLGSRLRSRCSLEQPPNAPAAPDRSVSRRQLPVRRRTGATC
jgi:hypothetical protein